MPPKVPPQRRQERRHGGRHPGIQRRDDVWGGDAGDRGRLLLALGIALGRLATAIVAIAAGSSEAVVEEVGTVVQALENVPGKRRRRSKGN